MHRGMVDISRADAEAFNRGGGQLIEYVERVIEEAFPVS